MRRSGITIIGIVVAFAAAPAARSQVPFVPAGARIRIAVPSLFAGEVVAVVQRSTVDTIQFSSAGLGPVTVPVSSVSRLQMSRGMHRSPGMSAAPVWATAGGALAGTLVGLPLAVLAALSSDRGEEVLAWSAGIGATVGLGIGIAIRNGSKYERWELVYRSPERTTAAEGVPLPPATWLRERDRVRIRVEGPEARRINGEVVAYHDDTVIVSLRPGHTATVDLSGVSDFRVYRGKSRAAGARAGVLWGAAAGLALGAALAAGPNGENDYRDPSCDPDLTTCPRETDLEQAFSITAGSAVIGAGVGALVGKDRWERVFVPRRAASAARFSVQPSSRGVVFRVNTAF